MDTQSFSDSTDQNEDSYDDLLVSIEASQGTLDEGMDDNLETAWDTELTQRLEDINRKTAIGEPSSQVFSELREKYS